MSKRVFGRIFFLIILIFCLSCPIFAAEGISAALDRSEVSAAVGESVTLTANVSGSDGNVSLQWFRRVFSEDGEILEDEPLSDANGVSGSKYYILTVKLTEKPEDGSKVGFYCVAADKNGAAASQTAFVEVLSEDDLRFGVRYRVGEDGDKLLVTAAAELDAEKLGILRYAWFTRSEDGKILPLEGENRPYIELSRDSDGEYFCVISNELSGKSASNGAPSSRRLISNGRDIVSISEGAGEVLKNVLPEDLSKRVTLDSDGKIVITDLSGAADTAETGENVDKISAGKNEVGASDSETGASAPEKTGAESSGSSRGEGTSGSGLTMPDYFRRLPGQRLLLPGIGFPEYFETILCE